jgi:DNA modification methylase
MPAPDRPNIFGPPKSLAVAYLPLESVRVAPRNARTHSQDQIQQLVRSIQEFGWTSPMLIDQDSVLIAGHGRFEAAKALGLAEVPTITLAGLTNSQKRALAIADNKLALNAGWDMDTLRVELSDLKGVGFDIGMIGFSADELSAMLMEQTAGLTDPDETPPAPVVPVSVLGDVWLLGRHRLVCGDSTTMEAVDAALAGVRPHLMVTDPPYGVEYDASWRNERLRSNGILSNGRAVGKVENDTRSDWRQAWALFPGDVAYVWCGEKQVAVISEQLRICGFEVRNLIVWAKSNHVISRGHYHPQHETCWYAVRKGATGHWSGDRKQTTAWQIDKPQKSETGHSTQKPVECMKRPIENNSKPGDAVYEPFSGSGTTIIAAEMTGRSCHAIELSPAYVDVAVKRWEAFTGQSATLASDGRTFAEIAQEREQ